jgi:hypothetical protein
MFDLVLFGCHARLERRRLGGDRPRHLAHLAMRERGNLFRVVHGLDEGIMEFVGVGLDGVELLAHVRIHDLRLKRNQHPPEVRESGFGGLGESLVMPGKRPVGIQAHLHDQLDGFAGEYHRIAVSRLDCRVLLQFIQIEAQLLADGIEYFLDQLCLFALHRHDLVEILRIDVELIGDGLHVRKTLGILDGFQRLIETLTHDFARLVSGRDILFQIVRDFACVTAQREELPIDVANDSAIGHLAGVIGEIAIYFSELHIGDRRDQGRDDQNAAKSNSDLGIDTAVGENAEQPGRPANAGR